MNIFILNDTFAEDTASGDDSIEAEGTNNELADTDPNKNTSTYVADAFSELSYISVTKTDDSQYDVSIKSINNDRKLSGSLTEIKGFVSNYLEGVGADMSVLSLTNGEDVLKTNTDPDNKPTNPNNITTGKTNTSSTVKGTEIKSSFALVEAKSLITSHDASGAVNPSFPQELQPRDRSNTKSVESIKENAKNLQPEKLGDTKFAGNGAPIVGDDLIVESGNGRVIAINTAYQNGSADNYKQWLTDNAQDFGFSSDQVQKYEQPVLVRVRETEVDRIDFTVEANLDPDNSVKNTEDDNLGDQNITPPQDESETITPSGDTPVTPEPPTVDDTSSDVPVTTDNDLASRVDTIADQIESSDFDAENFNVDALTAIADEAEGNSDLTAKLEAASEVYQNKLIAIAMQAMSDMVGN